ncbi:hypothetical protein IJ732_00125 [bacterium]|nr:hypothetical protein [bacterium]
MTLPHSMDYLMTGGVLDFDAAAFLNNPSPIGLNYPTMLGGTQMQSQPQKDTFSSKVKSKLKDTNFLKKAATVAIVGTLAFFGIKKGKNLLSAAKNTNVAETAANATASAKGWFSNLFKKVSK